MTEPLDPIIRGRLLRLARLTRRWNQTELGQRSGSSRRAVSELECGKVRTAASRCR